MLYVSSQCTELRWAGLLSSLAARAAALWGASRTGLFKNNPVDKGIQAQMSRKCIKFIVVVVDKRFPIALAGVSCNTDQHRGLVSDRLKQATESQRMTSS
jgi:hypothetical protein